jgi:predicted transcriptional regulator
MKRRKPSTVIRSIIKTLKEKPLSLRALETKVNTNDKTVKDYTALLQDLHIIKLKKLKIGKRIITKAELTQSGRKLKFTNGM